MNRNGNSSTEYHEYYLPSAGALRIFEYRPTASPGDEPLAVEVFDYCVISVLQLTALCSPGLEIRSVHIDNGLPLLFSAQITDTLFSPANYPIKIAYGASLCLLLNAPAKTETLPEAVQRPEKVTVETDRGSLAFEIGG